MKTKTIRRRVIHAAFFQFTCAWLVLAATSGAWGQSQVNQSKVKLPVTSDERNASGTTKTLLIALFTETDHHRILPPGVKLTKDDLLPDVIFMAYDDGTIVWSDDGIKGGKSLKRAAIDPKAIARLIDDFRIKSYFDNPALSESHTAPDSGYTAIYVNGGPQSLYMKSWHELVESQNPNVVVTSSGAGVLRDKTKSEVLLKDKQEYLDFRTAWNYVKRSTLSLVPQQGETSSAKIIDAKFKNITLKKNN